MEQYSIFYRYKIKKQNPFTFDKYKIASLWRNFNENFFQT